MIEKLDMKTPDFTNENIAQIAALFPNCLTETKDENGNLKKAIDFDLLKQELSENIVDGVKERYSLTWPGKKEALVTANKPINKTFRPDVEDSVNFDTTQNLYIEGDNLEALKLLQESYLNKIKMIYIDPPYNTGKDFVYKDNFTGNKDEELEKSGQISEEGRLVANLESNGRYHSDWLSMMYPRLKLARNLLKEDGVIFISIDDNEVKNLQSLCEEVFGEQNFIGVFPAILNLKGNQDAYGFAETHEYIVICTKNKDKCELNKFDIDEEELLKQWLEDDYGLYKEADNLRATGVNAPREKRPNLWYPIFLDEATNEYYVTDHNLPLKENDIEILPINPEGSELSWYWGKDNFNNNKHNLILKYTSNGWQFYKKQRPQIGDLPTKKPKSFFYKPDYSTSTATAKLKKLFERKIFDGPKPVPLIMDLLILGMNQNDIVLDFFSGSGTTAQAVLEQNKKDEQNRSFIMIQIPEFTDEKTEAFKAGYKNICEIGKERIKRAGKKILEESGKTDLDIGFRVLKIDSSNMNDVYYSPDEITQDSLFDVTVDNIKTDRKPLDLLFQVLLDSGVDLTLPIRSEKILGKEVYFVDENVMIACFEDSIDELLVTEIAKMNDILKVVFKDSSFKSDDMRINVEQIFKQYSPDTDLKVI